jgi:glycosyltransferase involved in cell wall biosynthesis
MLKVADCMTDIAFTSTPEGYRLNSRKKTIVGQGIDVEKFKPNKIPHDNFKIITVGRISPSKDYDTLIKAVEELNLQDIEVYIVGNAAVHSDIEYKKYLESEVKKRGLSAKIHFVGSKANKDLPELLQSQDLFINMSHTGSLDKAILEAMACGLPILTCNESVAGVLESKADLLMFNKGDSHALANKIEMIKSMDFDDRHKLSQDLIKIVVEKHNLKGLVSKISKVLNDARKID